MSVTPTCPGGVSVEYDLSQPLETILSTEPSNHFAASARSSKRKGVRGEASAAEVRVVTVMMNMGLLVVGKVRVWGGGGGEYEVSAADPTMSGASVGA